MSKVLEAVVQGGRVKVGSLEIPGAIILSEAAGDSQGLLFLEEAGKFYVAKTSPDLKTTLEKTIDALAGAADALTKVSTTLTSIGAGMTGPSTAPPPTLATDVADITTKVAAINTAKSALNTLKGSLK